jgi:signal transduction histidine kinase/PAS domain-containing protein
MPFAIISCSEGVRIAREASLKVLLISPDSGSAPDWGAAAGEPIEWIREWSLSGGEARLAAEAVDAVVVDAAMVNDSPLRLRGLRRRVDGAPVLLLGEPGNGLVRALDAATVEGILPAAVPDAIQGILLRAAVERARLEGRLQRSEARFRDVIERNADAIVVVCRDGIVRFANRRAEELFECPRGDLIGAPFGYPMLIGETTEVDLVRNGSPPLVVELRVVESEWDGQFACIISLRDITARKRAEEGARRLIRAKAARSAAEEAARRFRFLAEATEVLSSSLDYERTLAALARFCVSEIADWALVYMAEEDGAVRRLEVAHRDPGMVGLVRELRESPILPDGRHPVHRVMGEGEPLLEASVSEADLERIAENPRHLELMRALGVTSYMLVPLVTRGRVLGAIGLVCADPDRSFTEADLALAEGLASRAALAVDNARLYREAQEATRAKSDLLAVISHDLRTPLNSIIGYAELLTMGVPEPLSDGTKERVERMRAGAQQLLHLINQLLALARLDAGREKVTAEAVDLSELAREVAMVVEPLTLERKIGFQADLPPGPVVVETDPGKVRQVLMNLAANAVKFTDDGGVVLRIGEDGDWVRIQVEDTGRGIAPENRDRIFEPFWQVDDEERPRDGGTGLGLSVVHRLVELMGGRISVESEVGVGSTFTVFLPAKAPGEGG